MTPEEELAQIIGQSNTVIGYVPLPSEPEWEDCPILTPKGHVLTIPQDMTVDPFESAKALKTAVTGPVAMIIPGTSFDPYGGRKGRGGGWYDRLLSVLPRSG